MSKRERKRAQRHAQREVHELLRKAGRQRITNPEALLSLLEQVGQAVGLNQRRTNRLINQGKKVLSEHQNTELKPKDTIVVRGEEVVVVKLTDKTVHYELEGKVKRISRKNLFRLKPTVHDSKTKMSYPWPVTPLIEED